MISHNAMTTRMLLRRIAVISAVVVSLAVGGLAVRAAAAWTASSAPPTAAPLSAAQLSPQLADEQARVAALEQQLTILSDQTVQLSEALTTATDRMAIDAKNAKALRAKLLAAQRKLVALNRTAVRSASRAPAPARSAGGSGSAGSGADHDHDEDDDG